MIDHLLRFTDRAAAGATLAPLGLSNAVVNTTYTTEVIATQALSPSDVEWNAEDEIWDIKLPVPQGADGWTTEPAGDDPNTPPTSVTYKKTTMQSETTDEFSFAANVILNIGGPNDESVRVVLQDAVWDHSDPESPVLTTPEVLAPGWYCVACEPLVNITLRDLPDHACRLIADREKAVAGAPDVVVYTAPDMDPEMFATARVEPLPLGGRYPFGDTKNGFSNQP